MVAAQRTTVGALRGGTPQDQEADAEGLAEACEQLGVVVHEGTIRVRWCAKMHVRDPALGFTSLNVIDGVSVYELDSKGKISRHKIETIVMAKPDGLKQPVNLGLLWPTHAQQVPEMALPFFRVLDDTLATERPPL